MKSTQVYILRKIYPKNRVKKIMFLIARTSSPLCPPSGWGYLLGYLGEHHHLLDLEYQKHTWWCPYTPWKSNYCSTGKNTVADFAWVDSNPKPWRKIGALEAALASRLEASQFWGSRKVSLGPIVGAFLKLWTCLELQRCAAEKQLLLAF